MAVSEGLRMKDSLSTATFLCGHRSYIRAFRLSSICRLCGRARYLLYDAEPD